MAKGRTQRINGTQKKGKKENRIERARRKEK